jgi:hypothetical protein
MTLFAISFPKPHLFILAFSLFQAGAVSADEAELQQLIGALTGNTPQAADLQYLADDIGGRTTGTEANLRAVEWALDRFRDAGVKATKEAFTMPGQWIEKSTSVEFQDGHSSFTVRGVAKQFSQVTSAGGLKRRLVHVGMGTEEDFRAAGDAVRDAWILVETAQVLDLGGLFGEYGQAFDVEPRALAHGASGVIYQSPRGESILHRLVLMNRMDLPVLYIERQSANRVLRLLGEGRNLKANVRIDAEVSGEFESYNVVGEIEGGELKDEVVLIGAHLDSHSLGTGAIDDGGNATVLIDIARQMKRLGIQPRRTIRFVMWNGEEQGFIGSWSYTQTHSDEMDKHVLAVSIDTGEGPINGFFTNGRGAELTPVLDRVLAPVAGLGPFVYPDLALVGTDNYDFLLNGVPNLIGSQSSAELGPHYHAETDTLDKVDPLVMKRNAAVLAALVYGFATEDLDLPRQSADEVRALVDATQLAPAMKMFGVYDVWVNGVRAWQ